MSADFVVGLIYKNEMTKAQFGQLMGGLRVGFVAIPFGTSASIADRVKAAGCHLVISEHGDNLETDIVEFEALASGLGLPIYCAHHEPSAAVVRQFMRAGAHDVFPVPPEAAELEKEFAHLRARVVKNADDRNGKVISVLNSKSGSGATTIAVNLACNLAAADENLKVALIDFDIQFGSVSLYLDAQWQTTVMEVVGQAGRLDKTMLMTMMNRHDSGLYALPAPNKITRLDKVTAKDVGRTLEVARSAFDVVILDLPRAINEWSEEVLRSSDAIYMVIQRSLAVLRDAKLLMTYFPSAGIAPEKITVIDNRYRSKHSAVTDKQIEDTLKIKQMVRISNDYDTAISAQDHGVPLSTQAKNSRIAKDIEQLSNSILAEVTGEEAQQRAGLLGRFMGRS